LKIQTFRSEDWSESSNPIGLTWRHYDPSKCRWISKYSWRNNSKIQQRHM